MTRVLPDDNLMPPPVLSLHLASHHTVLLDIVNNHDIAKAATLI